MKTRNKPNVCDHCVEVTSRQAEGKQVSKPVVCTQMVKYFSWNCGGLPISKFDEVTLWADQNEFTMFALQETRRKNSCCWISGNYQIIQSGDAVSHGPSYAGVLLAVRKPIQVSYHEIIPGRLLHVRLDGLKREPPHNVLVVYNRPLPVGGTATAFDSALEARAELWSALNHTISSLPCRQSVIVLGDFNCHLSRCSPLVPSSEPSQASSEDTEEFRELLEKHALCLLNMGSRRQAVTFSHGVQAGVGSRIDYVLARHGMRSCMTAVSPSWHHPFQHASPAGWHAVLAGTFRTKWRSWRSGAPPAPRFRLDHESIRSALADQTTNLAESFCSSLD